ncbi:hypothetical protein CCP4SC76_2420001 [Gammaproteobacteria bacterium]
MFSSLLTESHEIQNLVTNMNEVIENKIKGAVNLQLNRNESFINELTKHIDGIQQLPDTEIDDIDDMDIDEEDIGSSQSGRKHAISALKKAMRAQAKAHVQNRSLGKDTRNGRIVDWLGNRGLSMEDKTEVGASLLIQINARKFINPVKLYLDGIVKRYRIFRRLRQDSGQWFRKDGFSQSDLHPLELDVILLAILRGANDLLSQLNINLDINTSGWAPLKSFLSLYKNQIFVDEATDFSPIQIACMASLAHPRLCSFFACGDFNQRLTTWGSRSVDDMKWVFPKLGVEVKEIRHPSFIS